MYLKWEITSKCHLHCIYCNNSRDRKTWEKDLDEDKLVEIINEINKQKDIIGVTIFGGEPFEFEYLDVFFKKIKKPFGLITSGVDIDKLRILLPNNYLKFITVSLDSLNSECNYKIKGCDIFNAQYKSLLWLIDNKKLFKYDVYINTVINNYNINYVIDMLNHFKESVLEIDRIQLLGCKSTGNKKIDNKLKPSNDNLFDFTNDILDYYIENKKYFQKVGLTIKYLPYWGKEYFEKKYLSELPIIVDSCSLMKGTINLNNRGKCTPCKLQSLLGYSNINIINKEAINHYVHMKNWISDNLNSSYLTPCDSCRYFKIQCFPCILLKSEFTGSEIVFEDCRYYIKKENEYGKR